ncbi:histone-lysine N-methyltransferase SETD2 [Spea bombifrons]|uniref:histone-lysine N-methyltransferase SETD2 n=1 Tax=Spea bombifrons TaxID=233779 RepID=UPI00234BEABF|nr:histone-lysine N-methyltransferase SETD2 [Spea bombifrons]
MGDFYDPEHPTEPLHPDYNREEEQEAKNENSSKIGFGKTSAFKGVSSSRFLPKGTKAKVNLEEQGRQKVSFSFSLTKKTFQNRLLTSPVNEKQNEAPNPPPMLSPGEQTSKFKMDFPDSGGSAGENSPPKPKVELGKIHFKKHLLSVTNKQLAPPPPPASASLPTFTPALTPAQPSPLEPAQSPEAKEAPTSQAPAHSTLRETSPSLIVPSQTDPPAPCPGTRDSASPKQAKRPDSKEKSVFAVVDSPSTQTANERAGLAPSKEYSHIGKEEKNSSSLQSVKSSFSPEKTSSKSKMSNCDASAVGPESDGDSVHTSSSHRSHELKSPPSKERDSKRSSGSLRSEDSGKHSSSRSRSTKEERYSSYSKSDRDSRYSYSHSRSDRERRTSRSHSRSPSRSRSDRAPRSGSSYSRSERSHYYESDRRYHRSSPYRTRYSRSRVDSRTRDSSDSEDEHRRSHHRSSDSKRPSNSSSSSYRDSRTSSHSKYDRDSKADLYDSDRRGRTSSRTERDLKKSFEPETSRKSSPRKHTESKPQKDGDGKGQNDVEGRLQRDSDGRSEKDSDGRSERDAEGKSQKHSDSRSEKDPEGRHQKDIDSQVQKDAEGRPPEHFNDKMELDADGQPQNEEEEEGRGQKDGDSRHRNEVEDRLHKDAESQHQREVDGLLQKDEDGKHQEDESRPQKDLGLEDDPEGKPPKEANAESQKDTDGGLQKDADGNIYPKAENRVVFSIKSKSKLIETKKYPLMTRSRSSKWDLETKELPGAVIKEQRKRVKGGEVAHENDPKNIKTFHRDPTEQASDYPGLLLSESYGRESKRKTQIPIEAKYDVASPDKGDLSLSPRETWNFVTLSSTEDPVLEEQNVSSFTDPSASDVPHTRCVDALQVRATKEDHAASEAPGEAQQCEASGDDHEVTVPPHPVEAEDSAAGNSELLSEIKSDDQHFMSDGTKLESPDRALERRDNSSFNQIPTPADETPDSSRPAVTDIETEATVDPSVPEDAKASELVCTDIEMTTEITYDLNEASDASEQSQPWDFPTEDVSKVGESEGAVATQVAEETVICSEIIKDGPVENEIQPAPTVLASKQADLVEDPSPKEQNAEKGDIFEAADPSNASTPQPEAPATNSNDVSEEEKMELSETPSVGLDSGDLPEATESGRDASGVGVQAVADYYSDTEESGSEESDTEDTDSDDSSMPRKRLQSVVIVPKNSTIAMEDAGSPPRLNNKSEFFFHKEEAVKQEDKPPQRPVKSPHAGTESKGSVPPQNAPEERVEPAALPTSQTKRQELSSGVQPPHSDGVVSTSQPEVSEHASSGGQTREGHVAEEPVNSGPPSSRNKDDHLATLSLVSNQSKSHQPVPSSAEKPDSRQGGSSGFDQVQGSQDYSRVVGFQAAEDLSCLGWDFTQPEKPSSTYQQPDSSYGYFGYNYQPACGVYDVSQSYGRDNGYWDPRLHRKSHELSYSKPSVTVPDSATRCYDEDDDDFNWETGHGQSLPLQSHGEKPRETGSVQAHEISSNSTKDNVAAAERREPLAKTSDRTDLKERGPFKKRRQELEADSEGDGEALEKKRLKADLGISASPKPGGESILCNMDKFRDAQYWKDHSRHGDMPPYFDLIEENMYLTERKKNKSHRDIKRMQCECPLLSKEERSQGEVACGEDCLNRLLMIECSSRCPNGEYCSNRRFQRKQHADVEVILTEKKGWGLRAAKDLKPNAFVLEYCGEVLDHKEFKARVKEYARNKNIHYYFMALKNDEIIDATQKGNCSRFMNHSCDPNCETQKWTVNGQLRVGFFTTRVVPAGSELTFDYQFQRYGKEAQKCFCGSANCRGYLGGENRVSIRAAGGKMKKERSRKKDSVDGELEALLENGEGLSDKNQVLSLSRLMVRIETLDQKLTCLKLIRNTQSQSCLKSFLECHGLSLLWIWMAELGDSRGNTSNNIKLQLEIIRTLALLPIPNKNMLEESKILPIVQRWAQTKMAVPLLSEGDGYSSENTSRAHTPLNTPDPAAKVSLEPEGETPKKLVFKRLKVISENSMDSAASDAASEVEVKEAPEKSEAQVPDECKEAPLPKEPAAKSEGRDDDAKPEQAEPATAEEPKTEPAPAADGAKAQTPGPEAPEAEVKENTKEEASAVETPSQDEEEGVSDVESERSQEPADKMLDMSDLAAKLLEGWKYLKEVYRIPKKSQAEKENSERWRDSSSSGYLTPSAKTQPRERDSSQRKRRQSPSPPGFVYERPSKRGDDRYDTPVSSKKKSRLQDRNKLSTEERRKLFEQEVAQREAQKQQQQMQSLGMASPIAYEPLPYGTQLPPPFMAYPPGYPIQSFVDPTNPNAGKVLLPTPPPDSVPSPNSYDPSQGMMVNSALLPPQPLPVVQHVAPPMDVPAQQYVAPAEGLVPQEANVAVLPVPAPSTVPTQSYGVWDPNQQTVAVQQPPPQTQAPYPPPPSQPAIYYQGQGCPTVYGVPTAYAQTAQPIVQSYPQPGLQYLPGQQIYAAHPQGVVVQQAPAVQTIVAPGQAPALQPPEMGMAATNLLDLPPPSPPKPKTIVLPPSWKTARDPEGKIYYYHVITRQTQWDPPSWDSPGDDGGSLEHEAEMDLGTPTYDENPMKSSKKAKTAEADTSSELAKKSKEVFRKEMSQFIVQCLNPYRKPDCKMGRINNTEDFKHLARKLTHGVMNKELKYCKNPEDLDCNENVKHKTKEYIKKYMQKFGTVYKPKDDVGMNSPL